MATIISHAVVPLALGLALGNKVVSWRLCCAGIICAILPDLDFLMTYFGVPYASPLGHRGFTHSLFFAGVLGTLAALLATSLQTTPGKAFLFITFATASHGILDAMTNGGLGVAFFWPFRPHRYVLPLRFIPVSPMNIANFMTDRGWAIMKAEMLMLWFPCTLFVASMQYSRLKKSNG